MKAAIWISAIAVAVSLAIGYPVPVDVLVKFILDHSGSMDPGIDAALVDAGIKRQPGPHGISTITRRISLPNVAITHKIIAVPMFPEQRLAGAAAKSYLNVRAFTGLEQINHNYGDANNHMTD
ncbi:hypothetical protein DSCO28_73480 (plasmid) [Desulfosarcina ovata subsp. sediminis]|uniref:Uncharacterized protein n=1 Tax=Desulfosarcina ovata subsp. sediminis TaxID=885957 RepID=A0A5K8A2N0_9BACT|nr:hypothetical protein DSCO28_73480 [Desulfosarcina ovata subsp. sediminis]